ncbi:MAG: HypC/HybG/HupF family hydrogenase formation chaperone [Candidatus Micrarchaeales archaeon]|jgi:hydrogenase maturation factor
MCQGLVGKVVKMDKDSIIVECRGETRKLRSKLSDVKIGDYVMFSLDIAIDKVDKEEAEMISGGAE